MRFQKSVAPSLNSLVLVSLLVAAGSLTLVGCVATLIPGTLVEDTAENRGVYDVLEAYRAAMEGRDEDSLRSMISRDYYENASTTDKSVDDYGYDVLQESVIPKLRDNIKKIQLRVLLKKVVVQGDRASAEFEYFAKYLFSEGGREEWKALNDFNRLDLVKEEGAWKITAGL
ncbi:MAG: hypothetical protein ACI9OJ_000629 [Myxococcota bacterium]|jgi:hypothetical protein